MGELNNGYKNGKGILYDKLNNIKYEDNLINLGEIQKIYFKNEKLFCEGEFNDN